MERIWIILLIVLIIYIKREIERVRDIEKIYYWMKKNIFFLNVYWLFINIGYVFSYKKI